MIQGVGKHERLDALLKQGFCEPHAVLVTRLEDTTQARLTARPANAFPSLHLSSAEQASPEGHAPATELSPSLPANETDSHQQIYAPDCDSQVHIYDY